MDFLSGLAKGDDSKKTGDEKSTTELFASAKVVAEAAQAQFSIQPEKDDKAKAAGAAADILDAAEKYGKLDQTQGVGKYVDQAENYLRQYGTTPSASGATPPASGEEKPAPTATETSAPSDAKPSEGGEKKEAESGYGGLMNAASGFLNK